ncbi:MAG: hypothetical protein K8R48_07055 [Alphaproteobacteria bacterium]|nr:hypothetical protein [Alphaproteobacteria bacterium]
MMEVTDKREMMANQLLMKGHATVGELMAMSYGGTWPPKGIEVDESLTHDQIVKLEIKHLEDLDGKSMHAERHIVMDASFVKKMSGLNSVVGHEALHVLQYDNSMRKLDTFGRQMSFVEKLALKLAGPSQPTSDLIMKDLVEKKGMGGLSEAFNESVSGLHKSDWRSAIKNIGYLRKGVEVQARMHQIISEGYDRWGRIPSSPDEFFAAMKSVGMKLPPDIEAHLEKLPEGSAAQVFLKSSPPTAKMILQEVKDINKVSNSFEQEGQNLFWHKVMPALYADMIEMYGDKNGGKKMGFDVSLKNAIDQKVSPIQKQKVNPSMN